jgi:endonuclease YncB( thermonuclease family)
MILLLAAAVTVVPSGETFTCTPTHVWDGDGPIWCAEGPHIRLSGIAARELDGACKAGHPCPSASGINARDRLVRLLGGTRGVTPTGHILVVGPRLVCRSTGSGGGNRTAAWGSLPSGRDMSCAMVATGTVLRWPRFWKSHSCTTKYR